MTRGRGLMAGLLGAALVACTTPPPVYVRPTLDLVAEVRHDPGSAVAVADVGTASLAAASSGIALDDALRVRCRFVRLAGIREELLDPLAAGARLLVGTRQAEPLLGTPRLLRGARVREASGRAALEELALALVAPPTRPEASEDEEVQVAEVTSGVGTTLAELQGALPAGATVALALSARDGAVRLRVHRLPAGDRLDVAVELEVAPGDVERALLPGPTVGSRRTLALVVPSPFVEAGSDAEREAVACLLEVDPAPAVGEPGREAHRLAVAACAGDLARARAVADALARPDAAPPAAPTASGAGTSRAVSALGAAATQRLALLGLASETGGGLALDLATSGSDTLVAAVASRALGAARRAGDPRGAELGHLLEQAALVELAALAETDDACDPAVHALLLRATGGLALRPSALLAAVDRDRAAWAAWLRAENRALLEDGDAATRARAAEWLAGRGALPPGFDPLAPADARRVALAAADDADAAAGGP